MPLWICSQHKWNKMWLDCFRYPWNNFDGTAKYVNMITLGIASQSMLEQLKSKLTLRNPPLSSTFWAKILISSQLTEKNGCRIFGSSIWHVLVHSDFLITTLGIILSTWVFIYIGNEYELYLWQHVGSLIESAWQTLLAHGNCYEQMLNAYGARIKKLISRV